MLEVTAAIIKENNKYLICQRASDDECAMLWEFPGGKREAGETLEECIMREMEEELKLTVKVVDVYKKTVYHFDSKEIHFTFFNCDILSGEIELNVHNAVKWVTAKAMKNYDFMPADVVIVESLMVEAQRLNDLK